MRPAPQVAQLRITLGVLRGHFDRGVELTTDPTKAAQAAAARGAAEVAYRRLAYESILRRLGTSVDELAAALRTEPAIRLALANRLGIDLVERRAGNGPPQSNLTQFLLPPDGTTGPALERLFGVVDLDATRGGRPRTTRCCSSCSCSGWSRSGRRRTGTPPSRSSTPT